jgi:broad specificity phosphatase PhoE
MSRIIEFKFLRHGPVFNPQQLWYGRDVDHDLTSAPVVELFNHLAQTLPSDPDTSRWLTSDYPRAIGLAQKTLDAVSRDVKPQLTIDRHFIEQQYGIMEGMSGLVAKKDPRLSGYFSDMWGKPPPEGESMQMLQARVGGRLDELVKTMPDHVKNIVVFAHGGVNMAAFAHATGQKMIDVFKSRKGSITPSFSYMSNLKLQFDRDQHKWLESFEYETGLPKHSPV